jgi:predicted GTPase
LEENIDQRITEVGEVVREDERSQQASYDELQHDKVLLWLNPNDQSDLQNKLQCERLVGTGQWLPNLDTFQS